jgi:hypothetical protein
MELSLKDFTSVTDVEKSRYLIMNKLKYYEKELNETKLYPAFQILIDVHHQMVDILEKHSMIYNRRFPDNTGDDEHGSKQDLNGDLEKSFELMQWAIERICKTLDTGIAIYDFVNENIKIESIGINSEHNQEGYFLIPDNREKLLKLIKYEKFLYRILKTKEVGNVQLNIIVIPKESLKNLINAEDILNQVIYYLNTELTFPFNETIMPVAKRKFLGYLENPGL